MAYSFAQLEGLWEQAGGSHALAPVMAAIALAESSGDPTRTGAAGEQGLWQINPHTWGSWATYDPLGNAKAAVHVAASPKGLGNWTTYSNGAYKHFLGSAAPSTSSPPSAGEASGGKINPNAPSTSSATSGSSGGVFGFIERIASDIGTGISDLNPLSGVSDIAQSIAALTLPFVKLAEAIDWFFVPSHWIRIFAGLAGGGLAIGGVYELAHTGDDHPAALPMGIGMAGVGIVLLFVAFHNLDPSVKTVGEFVADLQGKVQTDLSATTSPAAAVSAAGG